MAFAVDLTLRLVTVAYAEFRPIRLDQELQAEIAERKLAFGLRTIPTSQVHLGSERPIMAFLAPDQSRVLTIADQRMDYVFSGVPGALVGESGPLPWEAHVGEAAALFAEILEIVGIGAHRIAFVAEEISRDMPGRTPASAVRDRLVANPGNWELGNEWEWKVQTQRPAALERINVLLSAGGVSGEQNGAPFTGLRRLFDLNTPSESARPRFTASALPEALTGLVAVARIVESETTEFFQHGD